MFPTVVYEYGDGLKLPKKDCVITLGFFDGVHIAHRDLINAGRKIADRSGLPLGVFTFPAEGGLKQGVKRLYSTEERIRLLESAGVDFTVTVDFASVCSLSPEEFVRRVLIEHLNCRVAVVGFNFRFGRGAAGNARTLRSLMNAAGRECIIRDELKAEGETVCTTLIRFLLENGKIERANRLLGAPYRICAGVEHGRGVGRKLGFPTVNTAIDPIFVCPKHGVYRTAVALDGRIYTGVTNIGVCPTFDSREVHAETYIADFSGDLYGRRIEIYLLGFLRDEMRFSSPEELIMQINIDKNTAIKENGEIKWQELGLK